jgi:enoyl-CoA hydratase/carnithine racemase
MTFRTITATLEPAGVGVLTLDRPDKLNAISIEMRREISACLGAWAADPAVRVVVFTGAGRAFSAGFDLGEFREPALHEELLRSSSAYHRDVWSFPKPTIAAVNGLAAGGGFDLAVLCDLRVCSQGAWFAHPELALGAPPVFTPLRWIVGDGVARDLCLTRRRLLADEAQRVGLVREVVPPGELLPAARALAATIAEAPADALRFTKACIIRSGGQDFERAFAEEHDRAFREVLLARKG